MENNKEKYSLLDFVKHVKVFLCYVQRKLWLLLLAATIGVVLGILFYYLQKPKYEAACTFILEEKSVGGGGLAGLASQFGFDVGNLSNGGSIFSGDNILEILKSKKIIYKVLLSKTNDQNGSNTITLADLFLNFSGWRKKWAVDAELKVIDFVSYTNGKDLTPKQDSILNLVHEFLLKKSLSADRLNKKGSIIKVQVATSNRLFSRLMTERIVDEAARLYRDIKTGTAQANITQLQKRSDSLLYLLNRKSYSMAASQPLDINPGVRAAMVPVEITSRDKTVLATLYAEVTKNLEASKMLLSQQTPVIQILDRPGKLLKNDKLGLAISVISFLLLSVLVLISMLAISLFYQRITRGVL